MATETAAERMTRIANEQLAKQKAEDAQKKADDTAAADPLVAANKEKQDREEAEADLAARKNAAEDLAQRNLGADVPGVPSVTANAAGARVPVGSLLDTSPVVVPLGPVDTVARAGTGEDLQGSIEAPWRTFQHLYANANTIMPNGKKIIFGGQNGHIGQYSTNKNDQITHLAELANTPGSMVTEVRQDREGRYIVVTDAILDAEKQAALIDSRTNTARQQDPGVARAMANLGQTIAQNS